MSVRKIIRRKILHKQAKKHIQCTIENENKEKLLNFLDIKITKNKKGYEFDAYRKPGLTNVEIKSYSCIRSSTITSIFKGFLARANTICSEKYLRAKIECLTDMFWGKRYDQKTL